MARGVSIHIGVNEVDPEHYGGTWTGELKACENDANDLSAIADAQGFETRRLLTAQATRDMVIEALQAAAKRLEAGDLLVISYSGHGGQVVDVNGDEKDLKDETWCLYDGQLLDDELHIAWSRFAPGVRVWVLSDSCHSGTVIKEVVERKDGVDTRFQATADDESYHYRYMPRCIARDISKRNRSFYTAIQTALPKPLPKLRASVRLMSGCQDDQLSYEGPTNGRFTEAVKTVWADGAFDGNYAQFHGAVCDVMPAKQQSNHLRIGAPDDEYDRQGPWQI